MYLGKNKDLVVFLNRASMLVGYRLLYFTAGKDFTAAEVTLVFPPDVFALSIPVTILDDAVPEPPEMFQLNLFQVLESPTVFLDRNRADITINDEDGRFEHRLQSHNTFQHCGAKISPFVSEDVY